MKSLKSLLFAIFILTSAPSNAESALQARSDKLYAGTMAYVKCVRNTIVGSDQQANVNTDVADCKQNRDNLDALEPGEGYSDYLLSELMRNYDDVKTAGLVE
jgi:hypothetical protein